MDAQRVSIIIEWENVLLAEMDRCRRMLKELRRQIHELTRGDQSPANDPGRAFSFQIIVVYDQDLIPEALIKSELALGFPADQPAIEMSLAPSSGLHYYELKNFGARQADGEILLFLDSDVIPEPHWLARLLGAFANPKLEVVYGGTYVDSSSLIGKAFALTWIFPMLPHQTSLEKTRTFVANNLAFRKATFQKFNFPKLEGTDRGSCRRLAAILRENHVDIYRHNGARVNHPAPNGLRHMINRAVVQGRDTVLRDRLLGDRSWFLRESWRQIRRFARDMKRGLNSIARHRKEVNLSLVQTPLAVGIALGYYQCRLVAALMTQICPQFMKTHFRV